MRVTESEWDLEFSDEFDGENLNSQYWASRKELSGKINIPFTVTQIKSNTSFHLFFKLFVVNQKV
jgi:hypothetical protein